MNYESWRIAFQSSEQAARAAHKAAEKFGRTVLELQEEIRALEEENRTLRNTKQVKVVR